MGIFSHIITYQIGKRRGYRKAEENPVVINDLRDKNCTNYESFCKNFGSCDGMECEYE